MFSVFIFEKNLGINRPGIDAPFFFKSFSL
jgi:hypothetical protein